MGVNSQKKVPSKAVAWRLMVSKATVWCGGHTHWLLLWYVLLLLLLLPFLSSLSSFKPTLWSVIHRKRGRTGIKSESVGNRKGKHASEGAAECGGCREACVCGVSVYVCDDTFPLRLLRTSKRHLELCTDTELFNSIPLEPSASALHKAPT